MSEIKIAFGYMLIGVILGGIFGLSMTRDLYQALEFAFYGGVIVFVARWMYDGLWDILGYLEDNGMIAPKDDEPPPPVKKTEVEKLRLYHKDAMGTTSDQFNIDRHQLRVLLQTMLDPRKSAYSIIRDKPARLRELNRFEMDDCMRRLDKMRVVVKDGHYRNAPYKLTSAGEYTARAWLKEISTTPPPNKDVVILHLLHTQHTAQEAEYA